MTIGSSLLLSNATVATCDGAVLRQAMETVITKYQSKSIEVI